MAWQLNPSLAGFISITSVDVEDSQGTTSAVGPVDGPSKRYYSGEGQKASTAAPTSEHVRFVEWHERHLNDNRKDEAGWLAFACGHLQKGQGSLISSESPVSLPPCQEGESGML